jgi:hypothetical protein
MYLKEMKAIFAVLEPFKQFLCLSFLFNMVKLEN